MLKRNSKPIFAFLTVIVFTFMWFYQVQIFPELPDGIYTLYYCSMSSNAKIKCVKNKKMLTKNYSCGLKGKSVFINCQSSQYAASCKQIMSLITDYSAVNVFNEQGESFFCEYYYSARIPVYSFINGQKVNIHVAKSNKGITVGCPIIFGGY